MRTLALIEETGLRLRPTTIGPCEPVSFQFKAPDTMAVEEGEPPDARLASVSSVLKSWSEGRDRGRQGVAEGNGPDQSNRLFCTARSALRHGKVGKTS